jgi:hypothetical protein
MTLDLQVWPAQVESEGGSPMAFERHRDKNGETSRKHGNTLIRTSDFAAGCADNEKLSDVLRKLDEPSLSKLMRDQEAGQQEEICLEQAA